MQRFLFVIFIGVGVCGLSILPAYVSAEQIEITEIQNEEMCSIEREAVRCIKHLETLDLVQARMERVTLYGAGYARVEEYPAVFASFRRLVAKERIAIRKSLRACKWIRVFPSDEAKILIRLLKKDRRENKKRQKDINELERM